MTVALDGKKVLITREKKQAKEFSKKISNCGGIPIEVPMLKVSCQQHVENDALLRTVDDYEWIFFTSANGVDCFFYLAEQDDLLPERLLRHKIAAVGHKTERALKRYGLRAHFIPTVYDADHMAQQFLEHYQTSGRVLLVRGNRSRNVLPEQFSMHNISFDAMEVYETMYNDESERKLQKVWKQHTFDFITFTSPSTVDAYVKMKQVTGLQKETGNPVIVCIGTTTEKRAMERGFSNIIVPKQFTIDDMIISMSNYVAKKG
ncbi:MAG TPA: uroporphyrinogen-III synthase [Bacillota bacterium]